MHVHLTTTTAELKNLGLTDEQLKASVVDALMDGACGPDGERVDFSNVTIELQVLFTPKEFAQKVKG